MAKKTIVKPSAAQLRVGSWGLVVQWGPKTGAFSHGSLLPVFEAAHELLMAGEHVPVRFGRRRGRAYVTNVEQVATLSTYAVVVRLTGTSALRGA